MVPFAYGGFWDVPRALIFWYKSRLFMLSSYFEDELDDYDPDYSIHLLPSWMAKAYLESGWQAVNEEAGQLLGKVPVKDVSFDSTRRARLNPSFLDKYLETPTGTPQPH